MVLKPHMRVVIFLNERGAAVKRDFPLECLSVFAANSKQFLFPSCSWGQSYCVKREIGKCVYPFEYNMLADPETILLHGKSGDNRLVALNRGMGRCASRRSDESESRLWLGQAV